VPGVEIDGLRVAGAAAAARGGDEGAGAELGPAGGGLLRVRVELAGLEGVGADADLAELGQARDP
jgi:hypothetical protein